VYYSLSFACSIYRCVQPLTRIFCKRVYSTVCTATYISAPSNPITLGADVATLTWSRIQDEIVSKVVSKGLVLSSAGGFQVEDEDLQPLVQALEGSVDSVMGFPVQLCLQLMGQLE
jgi:predicted house-cleaning NTP pyrophosphatase (Maf/HAM1 superfamily)